MRKFLTKYFVLTKANDIRLGLTNISLLTIFGLLLAYTGYSTLTTIFAVPALFMLFVTFVYFRIWPSAWEELNDEQKWNYGWAIKNGKSSKIRTLTPEQEKEWQILDKKFKK